MAHPSESSGLRQQSPKSSRGVPEKARRKPLEWLDLAPWHVAGRFRRIWRGPTQKPPGPRGQLDLGRVLAAPDAPPAELAESLTFAVGEGALESAGRLATRLEPLLSALPRASSGRAREDVVETLIIHGERERATTLAQAHRAALAGTANGSSLLELLDLNDGLAWLPNGRPNLLGLSRQLGLGKLDARELASIVARKPWLWLSRPELHLLMFGALWPSERERALCSLNRFLELQGLPRLRFRNGQPECANVLASLEAESPGKQVRGPLVSVIVPARNAEDTVGYAVRSLLEQSYQNIEILLGDDASEDATLEVLRCLAAADSRIRLFCSSRPHGAYNVRNALARAARGALLAFHDADDLALPLRIASQVEIMQKNSSAACVGTWLRVTPGGRFVFFKNQKASRLSLVSLMLSRRLFFEQGGFRSARVGADLELYTRLTTRLGADAVTRIWAPLILGLWSERSITRQSGTEALEDGYRSAVRRSYSEQVSLLRRPGSQPSEADRDALLRASGNYVEPSEVVELTPLHRR